MLKKISPIIYQNNIREIILILGIYCYLYSYILCIIVGKLFMNFWSFSDGLFI